EHTKSPGKRHSLRRVKRGACNWLRSSSITSEYTSEFLQPGHLANINVDRQCSQVWARGQHGTRGESEWPEASHLVHCRF
ncbi:hypothetical protein POJ06DRAFT_248494, partial [Lipomyces tetrasporus]